jgi:hypothetical protein
VDFPIETTLNALSLFQKPIKLFSAAKPPEISLPTPKSSLLPNYVDPSPKRSPHCPPSVFLNPTAINYPNPSPVPAKASSSYTKQNRKSPYNTRPPKKPSIPSSVEAISPDTISSAPPSSNLEEKGKPH